MEAIPDAVTTEALLAHADWVRALARTLIADPHRADDVAQEAWVAALESPPRDARNLRGWFASVVRNAASQSRRSEMRRTEREKAAAREEAIPETAELVARASLQRDLVGHVVALDEPYRRTILLRFFQCLEVREIAQQEGVELSAVRTRLQRGIAKLRERLDREHGERSSWLPAVAALARAPGNSETLATSSAVGLVSWVAGIAACGLIAGAAWWNWPVESAHSTRAEPASGAVVQVDDPESRPPLSLPDSLERSPASSPAGSTSVAASTVADAIARMRVRGRVVDIRGNPIAGLRVRAYDSALPHREGGAVRWRTGTKGQLRSHWLPLDDELERRLKENPAVVEEFVTNDSPPGLREALLGIDVSTSGTTTTDGAFDLLVPGTDIDVRSGDENWVFACEGWTEMRTLRVFVAAPAIEVAGTIVDENAEPIAGAYAEFGVVWHALEDFPLTLEASEGGSWMAITGPDGSFRLPAIPAIPGGRIRSSKKGYVGAQAAEPDRSVDDLRIVLSPEVAPVHPRVRGIVLDEKGATVEGATVRLGQDEDSTDASGRFELEVTMGLEESSVLTATKRDIQAAVIEGFEEQLAAAPDGVEGVVLRMGGTALSITGTILDAEGRACPGWKIDLEDGTRCGTQSVNLEAATTECLIATCFPESDALGRFRIGGLRDRNYQLRAWSPESCLVVIGDPTPAGSRDLVLRVPPDAVRPIVRGTIVSRRGLPVPGVEVWAGHATNRQPNGGFQWDGCRRVSTDLAGRFEIRDLPRRHVLLSVEGDAIHSTHVGIPPDASGDDVRIEVDVQCRFRLEPRPEDPVDRFVLLDAQGQVVRITVHTPRSTSIANTVHRREKAFPVCFASEEAAVLVLYQGEQELRRVPLDLQPGELQVVVP